MFDLLCGVASNQDTSAGRDDSTKNATQIEQRHFSRRKPI
jgi:hypothetical protein